MEAPDTVGNIVNSLIGIVLVALFLGIYAVSLKSVPLAIIVVFVLALLGFDFVQAVMKENGNHR